MGFWRPDSLLSCSWTTEKKKKKELSKLSELLWTGPQFFYDPFTFVHECNVGNGADSNELRRVSQENVAQKCRLHNARLCLHYPDSFYPFTLRQLPQLKKECSFESRRWALILVSIPELLFQAKINERKPN